MDTPLVGFGKMPPYLPPAFRRAVALGSIRHAGMVLPGNGEPGTIPAGGTPPGQFAPKVAIPVGTVITLAVPLKVVGITAPVPAPFASGYILASGTGTLSKPPSISPRHSML